MAEAVYNAFQPDKLNYELLGVGSGVHMHWHIFPRYLAGYCGGGSYGTGSNAGVFYQQ